MRMEYTVVDPSTGKSLVRFFDRSVGPDLVIDPEASENLSELTIPLAKAKNESDERLKQLLMGNTTQT